MKIDKRFFICAMLVLMLFLCVNASSATEPLNQTLGADTSDEIAVSDAFNDELSASGDTYVVDGIGGDGKYKTISDAVSAATGGETIFIKNGEYSDRGLNYQQLSVGKNLTFEGESKENVIITYSQSSSFLSTYNPIELTFKNIQFKSISSGNNPLIGLTANEGVQKLTIDNCIFNDCGSKQLFNLGSKTDVTMTDSQFINGRVTAGSGTYLITFTGTHLVMSDCYINNSRYTNTGTTGQSNAIIYNNGAGLLEIINTTISNCTGYSNCIVRNNGGTVNISGSKIIDNDIDARSSTIVCVILFNNKGTININTTMIANNDVQNFIYVTSDSTTTIQYSNIQNNTLSGDFVIPSGTVNIAKNYWGSNDEPTLTGATPYIVYEDGVYKLSTGEIIDVTIPGLTDEGGEEPIALPEGTIYMAENGDDAKDGSSEANAIASFTRAIEIVQARENKTVTVYILNGNYTTAAIDITEANMTFIGQEKGKVVVHGTGKYIFDVYGDHLVSKFENIDFVDSRATTQSMGALRLYADYSNFTINNCNFRNISAKYGALDLQGKYGNVDVTKCVIENVTGSTSNSAIVYLSGTETTYNFDNIEIKNCGLDAKYASDNSATSLRTVFYVSSANVNGVSLTNSRIIRNYGPMSYGVIESKSSLTVLNTIISDNNVNTSVSGTNGGDNLISATDANSDISFKNCIITNNTIVKSGKGLFYNNKGKINVEYSDISKNTVGKFVGSTGTITADNNWWGTNDQPDTKVDKWVIMNVVLDDSDLSEHNKITLGIDFNHVKTASGNLEDLTGGEIPKDSYSIDVTAQNGEITPTNVVVDKGQTKSQTFTVTEINDVITLTCDGDAVPINIEGIPPYRGIIYVNETGSDDQEGSINAPVATVGKAIELALVNGGSGQIIIDKGTYTGCNYTVTGDLTITGNGKVTLDANSEGGFFATGYPTDATKIELSNLILANAKGGERTGSGSAINSFASELILDNVTIVNSKASGYLIKSNGKLTIKDSNITKSMTGDVIQQTGSGDILINNTVFENNVAKDGSSVYSVIDLSSGSGILVVENSKFINNTVKQGVIHGSSSHNIKLNGSEFIDNKNDWDGGAIYAYIYGGTLDVTDSKFINNEAGRNGGAIYIGYKTTATIDKSIFIDNKVTGSGYHGDAIYNGNMLTVTNSILLNKANDYLIYNYANEDVNAQNNWWGTNTTPKNLVYSLDPDDEGYEVDVSNWATMDASFTPADAQAGDDVAVTAVFSNANLPDGIEVTFTSTSGNLNTVVSTVEAQASTAYTIDAADDAITATSGSAAIQMPIGVTVPEIVTNDTFYNFFDDDGILKTSVTSNELIFKGEFSDLAAGYVIIDRPITINGDDAVLKNMGFVIVSEDVTLNKLNLTADTPLGDLISVGASNVDLTNLNISYKAGKDSGNAINVYMVGTTITDVNILNSNIYFESHTETDEDLVTAINLDNVKDVIVDGNNITASMPGLYAETIIMQYYLMGLFYVNPVRVFEASDVELTNNNVDVIVNSYAASSPTVQSLSIVGSEDVLVEGNNFTMVDEITPNGTAVFLYAINCGHSDGIEIVENNFNVSSTGGKSGSGSAYPIQTASAEVSLIRNNITSDFNGPNLGFVAMAYFGPAKDLIIKDNFFNISGYAAGTGTNALISGIEVQSGYATIYNNTIYVQNKAAYNERYPVAGVCAIQSSQTLSFDIQDNEIYTNGKYAVDIRYAPTKGIVTGNYLLSNELQGDKSVYIKSGSNNVIENNSPTNVVTNDTFYNFFDDDGVLRSPNIFKELIFNGTFSDLTDKIVINAPVRIVGYNATLNDIAISIISDNVKLSNLTLKSENKQFADNDGSLIYATGSGIEISDVVVNYTAPSDVEAIGIYANAAYNFKLTNSEINYVGTNPGSKHNYGLEVRDSENVSIDNNVINATLPAVQVAFGAGEGIDIDLVLAVGIQGGKNINFTENTVDVMANGAIGDNPTIDAIQIHSADNVLVNLNNITHIDTTSVGVARCYYGVDIYNSNAIVDKNNILVNTTSGTESGAAYPIQLTSPFTVTVSNNNLTTVSRGPNTGIYAALSWTGGFGDLTVEGNIIDVTGYAVAGGYALVSGIEAEIDVARVYENTIKVSNLADYDDTNPVYGVSIADSAYMSTDATADIRWNNMTVDGKYAVYYKSAVNTNVTFNELLAHELEGNDAAFIASGDNNYIDINFPPYLPKIIIEAHATWIGNEVPVNVTVVNTTGTVTIKVNEKEFKDLVLVNGNVLQIVSADDLVPGINNVTVTFTSTDSIMRSGNENCTFYVLNGVVTQDNYLCYFNPDDKGQFFDYVPEGATLDFQGSIIVPDESIKVNMTINKPVNIISTTGDAYIDLCTVAKDRLGTEPGNLFAIVRGGSGTNVTGIHFHNTQLWIANTTNVVLDNISVVVEDQKVGWGIGATSIRENSSNVVLKNSYCYTRNNGGSTTFTLSWATNCTIDNCTVKAEGDVGNLVYLNPYNIAGAPSGVPLNNYNKVINNRIYGKEGSSISVGLMVEGQYNLIENNTLYKCSIGTPSAQKPYNNTYVGNTMTEGGSLSAQTGSIVYNNNVTGKLTTGKESIVYNNTVGTSMTVTAGSASAKTIVYNNTVATSMSVGADSVVYNNTVGTSMTVAARAVVYNNTVGSTVNINGKDAVVENNTIGDAVTIGTSATNTNLNGNNITGTVTVNSNNNNIKGNNITSTGNYAIDLKAKTGNTVTDNYLVANVYKGDKAITYSNSNNVVENNLPIAEIIIVAEPVWIGSNGLVTVNIVNGTGSVTIKVNSKEYVVDLDNGVATKEIPSEDLVVGANPVTVTYESVEYAPATNTTVLAVLDGVVTQDTYMYYFNQEEDGKLFDCVPEGATLDFQGSIINPDTNVKVNMNLTKPVNIISTTGDAYVDLNTTAHGGMGQDPGNRFTVSRGGSGSNITGIYFHNTQLWISNTSNVVFDNISVVAEGQSVGSGVGVTSIRDNSSFVTVKNSYFFSKDNGRASTLVLAWAENCTIDNNTISGEGGVGNLLYLNVYNIYTYPETVTSYGSAMPANPVNNYNKIINNRIYGTTSSSVSIGLMVEGTYNIIENNTLYQSSISTSFGAMRPYNNTYVGNVMTDGGSLTAQAGSIVYNNNVSGALSTGKESTAYNNTVGGKLTVGQDAKAYNNTVGGGATTGGTNAVIENNTIAGAVTINKAGTTFVGNDVSGTVTVSTNNNVIENNTIISTGDYAIDLGAKTDNTITGNYLIAKSKYGQNAVRSTNANNIIDDNRPYNPGLVVKVENITVGEDAIINVTVNDNIDGVATVIVDGKTYTIDVVNGSGSRSVSDLAPSDYTVTATFVTSSLEYGVGENSTVFNVAKLESDISIEVSGAELGKDTTIAVSIPGATGNVTVIVNGKEENITLDENGKANYTIEKAVADDYNVVVIYPGDKDHGFAYATDSFTVPKYESKVDVTADSEAKVGVETTITVDVTDGATGTVIVNVNGTEYAINLTETNSLTVAFDKAGEYTVVATYMGDDMYNASESKAATIVVSEKQAANIKIEIPDEIKVGDKIIINVTADSDAEIIVYINGEAQPFLLQGSPLGASLSDVLTYALDKKVAYEVAKEGVYNITVVAKENDEYASQVVTKIFEATKNDAEINITPITNAKVGDNVTIEVVTNTDGNLTITVNGEEVTGEYEITKAGSYTINVVSAETQSYNGGFATYTFVVEEEPVEPKQEVKVTIDTPSDVKAGDNTNVTVTIENATGDVTVIIDGKLNTVTLDKGTATVAIENIGSGNHSVVVIYAGDEKFNGTLETATFNVAEEPVEPITNMTVVVDGKEYTAEIVNGTPVVTTEPVDNNITVVVDGKEYAAEVVNGTAVVTTEPVTNMTVVVDGKEYNAEIVDGKAVVTTDPVDNNITVVVDGKEYAAEVVNGTAVVTTEPVTNMTVVVDGKEYTAEIVNGTAVVTTEPVTNMTVVVDGKEYNAEIVDGKAVVTTEPVTNMTVVVDGKEYAAEVVNGTAVVTTEPVTNMTVVVDGKEYNAEIVDGKAVVTTDPVDNNITVVVDGKEYAAEVVNGTAVVTTGPVTNMTVVVDGKEYNAEIVDGKAVVTTDPVTVPKASEFSEITISDTQSISIVLKDADGNIIANAPITYTVNGAANATTTGNDGKFVIQGENGALITINYAGNDTIAGTNMTLKLNTATAPEVVKVASHFDIDNRAITINGYAVDGPAGEQGIYYATTLLDEQGKPISNVYIEFAVNNKIYNRTTYENGSFAPYKLNMVRAGRYTMAFNFAGDDNYTNAFACVCVDLDKKPITIKASAKSYKAATKTKKYTVTLSTIKGLDGKMYLSPKTVKLTVKGKTYTGKTNAKGQVTFKITNLNKKGKYTANISFKGDKTYEEANKSVKLTIK